MFEEQFKNIPAQPPRPVELLPGLKLSAQAPQGALISMLILVAAFLLIPLTVLHSNPAWRLALGPTRTVSAQVLSVTDVQGCQNGERRLVYSFTPEQGGEFRDGVNLCRNSPYWSVEQGGTVPVKYLVSNPSNNAIVGTTDRNGPPVFIFFLLPVLALLIFSQLFLPQYRAVSSAKRLFTNGRMATGSVVFVRRRVNTMRNNTGGIGGADVFISYRLASGEWKEGKAWCGNDWLLQQLDPGAEVHIAYLPERPDEIALLEAFLR
jgi:hypothetical protein